MNKFMPVAVVVLVLAFLFIFLVPRLGDRGSMAYVVVGVPALVLVGAVALAASRGKDTEAD